jgi:hypothetical protein
MHLALWSVLGDVIGGYAVSVARHDAKHGKVVVEHVSFDASGAAEVGLDVRVRSVVV